MIPRALQDIVDAALTAVRQDAQHDLPFSHRFVIYTYFGPDDSLWGRYRRGRLALIAATRVLPIWQEARPNDRRGDDMLCLAREILSVDVLTDEIKDTATERAAQVWQWSQGILDRRNFLEHLRRSKRPAVDDLKPPDEDMSDRALWALGAGVKAVWTAMGHDPTYWWYSYADRMYLESAIHQELEPYDDGDAAQWAAFALAGRPERDESNETARLQYWTWWLTEAVPAAWQSRVFGRPFSDLAACAAAARAAREQMIRVIEELRVLLEDHTDLEHMPERYPAALATRLEQDRRDVSETVRVVKRIVRAVEEAEDVIAQGGEW